MKITNELEFYHRKSGGYTIIAKGSDINFPESDGIVAKAYAKFCGVEDKSSVWESLPAEVKEHLLNTAVEEIADAISKGVDPKEALERGIKNLINFFTEFDFEPNFRFLNTLAHNIKNGREYIENYFELTDNSYKKDIVEKMRSKEFNLVLDDIKAVAPTKTINNRFKLYYGSQGTGKTTIAQKETANRCVICNASMLPADLMEDFIFVDGKATFKKSLLWECMEKGLPLVLDEINLLPFDSLRFLQGLLDGKAEFNYKGNKVVIADGFKIIGTMNLTVNGMTYGLPEPLVDRCAEMKKFRLTEKDLVSAIV